MLLGDTCIFKIILLTLISFLIRCSPTRSWKHLSIQSIKMRGPNVVRTSADLAVCVPVSGIWTEVPSTAGGLNACLAVLVSNARSSSTWAQWRLNNRPRLFTVRLSNLISCVCVVLFLVYISTMIDFIWLNFLFEAVGSLHSFIHNIICLKYTVI